MGTRPAEAESFIGNIGFAFDAANALIEAMKEANSTDPARYLSALAVNKFIGVSGLVSFDAHGDVLNLAYALYRAENGKWNYLRSMGGVTYRR